MWITCVYHRLVTIDAEILAQCLRKMSIMSSNEHLSGLICEIHIYLTSTLLYGICSNLTHCQVDADWSNTNKTVQLEFVIKIFLTVPQF